MKTAALPLSQDARALWLALRREGGWWTASQLMRYWHPTFEQWEVNALLNALVDSGFLERRDQPGLQTYGITPDCPLLPTLNFT